MLTADGVVVGRDGELGALPSRWARSVAGEPQVVIVTGDPGIGKTALLNAFGRSVAPDVRWLLSGDQSEQDIPYGVVDQLFRDTGSSRSWSGPHEAGAALLEVIGSASGPIMLVVDDLHLVDAESLIALQFALRRLRSDPVLAVFTARWEESATLPPGLPRLAQTRGARLILQGLTDADVLALAAAVDRADLDRRAAQRLRRHTGGNPLHLRALLRELGDDELRSDDPLPAPRNYALLVRHTLGALSPVAQSMAQAAAVLPDGSTVGQLAALVRAPGEPLGALQELFDARLVGTVGVGPDLRVRFCHSLIQAAVYDGMGPAHRRMLHRRAGSLLDGEASLRQLVAAAVEPDPDLAQRLAGSAREHLSAARWRCAAANLLDAARLSADRAQRDDLVTKAVDAFLLAGDAARAMDFAGRMAAMPASPGRLLVRARLAFLSQDHALSESLCRTAWSSGGVELSADSWDNLAALLAQHHLARSDPLAAVEWSDIALRSIQLSGAPAVTTRGTKALALGLLGRTGEGLRVLGDLPDDPWQLPPGRRDEAQPRGILRMYSDDLAGAERDLRAVSEAPEYGLSPNSPVTFSVLADTLYRLGRWDESLEVIDRAATLVEDTDQRWFAPFVLAHSVLVPAARGDFAAADVLLGRARTAAAESPSLAEVGYLGNAAAHLAAQRGDWPAVLAVTDELMAHDRVREVAVQPGPFTWPVRRAEALVRTDQLDAAERWLADLERVARPMRHRSRLAGTTRIRAELAAARRDTAGARAAYRSAIELGEGVEALESATAHAAYGRFLRRRGERRSAIERLTTARRLAVDLGAMPLVGACTDELAASGMPVVAPAIDGRWASGLTPQERAVARLACAGKSNKQIARELVLSSKTIGFHLGNVYAKLGVHSRSELIVNTPLR